MTEQDIEQIIIDKQQTLDLWKIFCEAYQKNGHKINYDINNINDFVMASLTNEHFKEHLERYMIFSIGWLATNIINALTKTITEITEIHNIDIDYKSRFVIFDRMIKQLHDLIKLRNKLSEMMNTTTEHKRNNNKIDYTRLL